MAVTVQKGDTLWDIAQRELGDGRRYKELAKLNGIKNPKKLKIGSSINLPGEKPSADVPLPRERPAQGGQFMGGNGATPENAQPKPDVAMQGDAQFGGGQPAIASLSKALSYKPPPGPTQSQEREYDPNVMHAAVSNRSNPLAEGDTYQPPIGLGSDPNKFGNTLRDLAALQPATGDLPTNDQMRNLAGGPQPPQQKMGSSPALSAYDKANANAETHRLPAPMTGGSQFDDWLASQTPAPGQVDRGGASIADVWKGVQGIPNALRKVLVDHGVLDPNALPAAPDVSGGAPVKPMGSLNLPIDPVTGQEYKRLPEAYLGVRGDAGGPPGVQVADASGVVPASAMPATDPWAAVAEPVAPAGDPWAAVADPVAVSPDPAVDPTAAQTYNTMAAHPPAHPQPTDWARTAKLASQNALRGVGADLPGLVADLPTGLANLVVMGLNAAGGPFGLPQQPLPFSPESKIGMDAPHLGDRIATGASQVATWLDPKLAPIPPEQQTPGERITGEGIRIGAGAAAQSALLALVNKLRGASDMPRAFDSLTKPYDQSAGETIARDATVGVGAGTGEGAYHEAVPKEHQGVLGTLLTMLAGSVGGGFLHDMASGGGSKLTRIIHNLMPSQIPYDKNGMPTLGKTADDAAKFVQDAAGGRQASGEANKALDEAIALAQAEGRPVPPLGQATQNLGLARAERGVTNTLEGIPTIDRNQRITDWAGEQVKGIAPNADPAKFISDAERAAQEAKGGAAAGVESAGRAVETDAAARAAEAERLAQQYGGAAPQAAATIDRVAVDQGLVPATERSNAMYNAADPHGAAMVPTDNLIASATAVRDSLGALNTPAKVIPQGLLRRIGETQPSIEGVPVGPAETSIRSLVEAIPEISSTMTRARNAQNYTLVDNLRTLRDEINRTIDRAAAGGDPEAAQAVAARQNYEQNVAPVWNVGPADEAKKLRQDFNLDRAARTKTPPSQTADRFLQPGQPEKAASLQRIFDSVGTPAGPAAARDFIMSHAANAVVRDGRIDGAALGQFARKWGSVIDAVPGLRAQFDQLTTQVGRGDAASGQLAEALTRAQGQMKMTEQDIADSALSIVAGRTPRKAVEAIMGSKDPSAAVTDLYKRIGNTPGAKESVQRAVADWLYAKVTNSGTEGNLPVSYAKIVSVADNPDTTKMLATVFEDPEAMNAIQRVRRTLDLRKILDTAKGSAGSPTAANLDEQMRLFEAGMRTWFGGFKGGNMARNIKVGLGLRANADVQKVKELVGRAMVDPRVAKALLSRKLATDPHAWGSKVAKLMRWEEAAKQAN